MKGVLMVESLPPASSRCCLGVGAPGHDFFLSWLLAPAPPPFPSSLQVRQGKVTRQGRSSSPTVSHTGPKSGNILLHNYDH